jgi:Tat protein secretion system quality control protein TatD with DNase activity
MIETDSPVVYPVRESQRSRSVASSYGENKIGFSSGVNRLSEEKSFKAGPKDVFFTLDVYAKLKNLDKEKAASVLNANAKKFFNLPL